MSFYKLCICGKKNVFESRREAPRKCSNCQRDLLEVSTMDENKDEVGASGEENEEAEEGGGRQPLPSSDVTYLFSLEDTNGKYSIDIPPCGGILGREALGAEYFSNNMAVSRKHIRVTYRDHMGVMVEDISKFGTYVNGELLMKGSPIHVFNNDIIRLYNVELRVRQKIV